MNFNFGEVLVRAWKIVWKHKVLWIFGLLASCGSQSFGSSNSSGGGGFQRDPNSSNQIIEDAIIPFVRNAIDWFPKNIWTLYVAIGILVVLGFIQFTVANFGHIGLIRGTYRAEMGAEKVRFGELWDDCRDYFWRAIGLSLAVWGPILVILIGLGLVFINGQPYRKMDEIAAAFSLSIFTFCCCLFPFKILLDLYHAQAIRSLTLETPGILEALKRGWQVFSGNLIELFIMDVVLFIINLILNVVITIPASIAVMLLAAKFMNGSVDTWTPVIFTMTALCAYAPVAWFLRGVATSYAETAWTLVYMRVTYLEKDERIPVEFNA